MLSATCKISCTVGRLPSVSASVFGFRRSALSDFFESPETYEIINGQLYAISDLEGYPSIDENSEVENVHAFEFSYTRERLPFRNKLCSDQISELANTLPDTLVECWGALPPEGEHLHSIRWC